MDKYKVDHKDRKVDYHQLKHLKDNRSTDQNCKKVEGDIQKVIKLAEYWNKVAKEVQGNQKISRNNKVENIAVIVIKKYTKEVKSA